MQFSRPLEEQPFKASEIIYWQVTIPTVEAYLRLCGPDKASENIIELMDRRLGGLVQAQSFSIDALDRLQLYRYMLNSMVKWMGMAEQSLTSQSSAS